MLAASVVLMLPALWQADRPGRGKPVFVGAVAVLFAGQLLFAVAGSSLPITIAALVVFFTGFNLLEAMLPSLVSKFAPPAIKGTATGVYSSVQFLGTFAGAAAGGWLSQWHGAGGGLRIRTRADRVVARGQRRHVGAADVQFAALFDGRNVTWPP